ncbi:MAG TPA: serine/threonine protein kinase, partial [Chloroflexi bacterium]|nr:serine/threonine protein kinase [Chloroflexota bacterium]
MSRPSQIGPYRIIEKLGRGRHATVYKAARPDLDRPVALKVLRDYDQATLEKFEREARLSKRLKIPGVRRTYEAGRTREGQIFLAMAYVDASLKEVIRRHGRAFTRDEAVRLLEPVAQALDAIHQQGLVHLDVKPENILVSGDGRAVLADFGVTRRQGELTTEGTPRYMSPEQATGDRPVSPQSDVYSLGVVIYEMLTGRPPFQSERDDVLMRQHVQDDPPAPRDLNPRIDRAAARTLLSALNKVPHERPISAGALLRELAVAHSTPITIAVDVVRERPQVALIPAGVLAAAALVFFLARPPRPPSASPSPSTLDETTGAPTAVLTTTLTPALSPSTPAPETGTPTSTKATPTEPTSTPRPETATPTRPPASP